MHNQKATQTLKNALLTATILALVNTGDAFLYAYLPSNYQSMGLTLFWVGLILSINRFARLFLNAWVAHNLSEKGIKVVSIVATLIAVFTTLSYGFISSIYLWILVRILWGLSFSTLRLSNSIFALQYHKRGIALGFSRSIIELGAVFSLLVGPLLIQNFDRKITFLFLGVVSLVGFILTLNLPNEKTNKVSKKELILTFPSSFNIMVWINAFILEGVLIVLTSKLIQIEYAYTNHQLLYIVGLILGYRRLCFIVFSPVAGWYADKLGFEKVFVITSLLLAIGLLLISLKMAIIGLITVFTFGAMNASIATGGAVNQPTNLLKDVNDNATWRDIGTALGSFIGALLLTVTNIKLIITLLLVLLIFGVINHQYKLLGKKRV